MRERMSATQAVGLRRSVPRADDRAGRRAA